MTTGPTIEGAPDGRSPDSQLIIEEKRRILRLLRALDRAGVNPEVDTSVRVPLVRLSEVDGFLTAMLELAEREGGVPDGDEGLLQSVHSMLPISEALRGDVLDSLAPRLQKAVRRTSGEVVASEAEILLEVEGFRRRATPGDRPAGPIAEAEVEEIARKAWTGDAPASRPPRDAKVRTHERKAPPNPEAPLRAWFDRTPRPWREVMARYHDIPRKGAGALALRLVERVSDPVWMQHFLTTRFGASEREMLARFLASPVLEIKPDDEELLGALHVPWDWARQFPASVGGKLRAAGLVHVGSDAGDMLAIVPPPLLPMLRDLLPQVDPESAALPERAMRQAAAELVKDTPFEGGELAHWKKIDLALWKRIERWVLDSADGMRPAVDAFFQDQERTVYSPEESAALFEYGIFDWRAAPGKPTLAEKILPNEAFDSPEESALAAVIAATLPTLYRVEEIERGQNVLLRPLFPAGDAVIVADRGLSLTAELGVVLGLRVYPAGPFHFARLVGNPLEAHQEKVMVRALRRKLRAFVRDGGTNDPVIFLRERPRELLWLIRELQV